MARKMNRRSFLRTTSVGGGVLVLAACGAQPAAQVAPTGVPAAVEPTIAPAAVEPTTAPAAAATTAPAAAATAAPAAAAPPHPQQREQVCPSSPNR